MSPDRAKSRGLTSTVCFPVGNVAPEGAVIKSTAIDPSVVGADGIFRMIGPARIYLSEHAAIESIKNKQVREGDVMVLMCRGPMGAGMEETYQVTSALKHLPFGKHVALLTDARFSGVSTGACIWAMCHRKRSQVDRSENCGTAISSKLWSTVIAWKRPLISLAKTAKYSMPKKAAAA